jgi:hypothetical protein
MDIPNENIINSVRESYNRGPIAKRKSLLERLCKHNDFSERYALAIAKAESADYFALMGKINTED